MDIAGKNFYNWGMTKKSNPDNRVGLRPHQRKPIKQTKGKRLTANQWVNSPQQNLFMEAWLDPTSPTFSNAYQSALSAGYTKYYAEKIASSDTGNQWIGDYVRRRGMNGEHIVQGLQDMYLNPKSFNNSRSPADTRLKTLELLAKITGILEGNKTTVTIVQPILGGASEPRKVIDQD